MQLLINLCGEEITVNLNSFCGNSQLAKASTTQLDLNTQQS